MWHKTHSATTCGVCHRARDERCCVCFFGRAGLTDADTVSPDRYSDCTPYCSAVFSLEPVTQSTTWHGDRYFLPRTLRCRRDEPSQTHPTSPHLKPACGLFFSPSLPVTPTTAQLV